MGTIQPSDKMPWNLQRVVHLYRRASFGGTWNELQTALTDGPDKSIDRLFKGGPVWQSSTFHHHPGGVDRTGQQRPQLAAWWLHRMLYTPHPLLEKLTLFCTIILPPATPRSNARFMLAVRADAQHPWAISPTCSRPCEGSGHDDLADTRGSKKGNPKMKLCRELMSCSAWHGHYTEKDIREAARLYGMRSGTEVTFNKPARRWGQGVLGQTGNSSRDMFASCLEQKSAPLFIVGQLYPT